MSMQTEPAEHSRTAPERHRPRAGRHRRRPRAPPGSPPPEPYPRSTLALWGERPDGPGRPALRHARSTSSACSALFGRRMLDRLWADGPGSGPGRGAPRPDPAVRRARHRPAAALALEWEEWSAALPGTCGHLAGTAGAWSGVAPGDRSRRGSGSPVGSAGPGHGVRAGRCREVPPLLCHGTGDAVTVPPLPRERGPAASGPFPLAGRPRHPAALAPRPRGPAVGLPCGRPARRRRRRYGYSIFPPCRSGAKVYDVSRRR